MSNVSGKSALSLRMSGKSRADRFGKHSRSLSRSASASASAPRFRDGSASASASVPLAGSSNRLTLL